MCGRSGSPMYHELCPVRGWDDVTTLVRRWHGDTSCDGDSVSLWKVDASVVSHARQFCFVVLSCVEHENFCFLHDAKVRVRLCSVLHSSECAGLIPPSVDPICLLTANIWTPSCTIYINIDDDCSHIIFNSIGARFNCQSGSGAA